MATIKQFWFSIKGIVLLVLLCASVTPASAFEISGTVYDDTGTTIDWTVTQMGVDVVMGDPCGSYEYVTGSGTNPDGSFAIDIPDGMQIYVRLSNWGTDYIQEWYTGGDPSSSPDCHAAVSISGADNNVNFAIERGGSITGTIFESDDSTPIISSAIFESNGTGTLGVDVFRGSPCNTTPIHGVDVDSYTGEFFISGLQAGEYYIRSSARSTNYIPEYWAVGGSVRDCSQADSIIVEPGGVSDGKRFQLERGGAISGTLYQNGSTTPIVSGTSSENGGTVFAGVTVFRGGDPCNMEHVKGENVDSGGNFIVRGLEDGDYYLKSNAQSLNYIDEYSAGEFSDPDCHHAQPVTVTSGQINGGRYFQLEQGAKISGVVTDKNDATLAGVHAHVHAFRGSCGDMQWVAGGETNENGEYTLVVSPGEQYFIRADADGNYIDEFWNGVGQEGATNCDQAVQTDAANVDVPLTGIDFKLAQGRSISGTVSDANGTINGEENNLGVSVYSGDPCERYDYVANSGVEADGTYSVRGIRKDIQTVYAKVEGLGDGGSEYISEWYAGLDGNNNPTSSRDCHAARPLPFTEVVNTVEASFTIEKGRTISGTISDANGTINGEVQDIGVEVLSGADGACNETEYITGSDLRTDGSYVVGGIPKDIPVYARVNNRDTSYIEEWYAGTEDGLPNGDPISSPDCHDAVEVPFTDGRNDAVSFAIKEGRSISGTITDQDGSIDVTENEIDVDIVSGDPCKEYQHLTGSDLQADGTYGVDGISKGIDIYARVSAGETDYVEVWYAGTDENGDPVNSDDCSQAQPIREDQAERVDFRLAKGGAIKGIIYKSDGKTLLKGQAGMGVGVFRGTDPCNLTHVKGVNLDPETGTFTVSGLAPGQYYLKNWSGETQYLEEYWASTKSVLECSQAQSITVTASQTVTGRNFQLDLGGAISGTLYLSDGTTPVTGKSNIGANVWQGTSACDANHIQGVSVNPENGTFVLNRLAPGTYYLRNWSEGGGYVGEYWASPLSVADCTKAQKVTVTANVVTSGKNFQLDLDTDNDGIGDNDELNLYHTDPAKEDSDGDGILDGGELELWGTAWNGDIDGDDLDNLHETDADGDDVSDIQEIARGSDMQDPSSVYLSKTVEDFDGTTPEGLGEIQQYKREIVDGGLRMGVVSSTSSDRLSTGLKNITNDIKAVRTEVTVHGGYSRDDSATVYAELGGQYYHTHSSPADMVGLVNAGIQIGDRGQGLEAWYYIIEFVSPDGQWETLVTESDSVVAPGTLQPDTKYKIELVYGQGGDNHFNFAVYDENDATIDTVGADGPAFGAGYAPSRTLATRTVDGGGKFFATFDNVRIGEDGSSYEASVYDDFSADRLDKNRWTTPEYVREITEDNQLRMVAQSFGDTRTANFAFQNLGTFFQTTVKIDAKSIQSGAARGRTRLGGYLYNDSHGTGGLPYNGQEGDVYGQVGIDYTEEDGFYAFASVYRVNTAVETEDEDVDQLLFAKFKMEILPDTPYTLSIGFGGDVLICTIDGPNETHEAEGEPIETPKYLPFNKYKQLTSKTYGNNDEGVQASLFDDLKVAGKSLAAGDVNLDGAVDLKDAVLSLRTVTGDAGDGLSTEGDINEDKKIGLPEAVYILNNQANP